MKKALFAVLLAGSLGFNAVLLYQQFNRENRSDKHRKKFVKVDIKPPLTDEQKRNIKMILRQSRSSFSENRVKIMELKMKIVEEIAAPDSEPQEISEMVEKLNLLESDINIHFVNTLIKVSESLEFEQRVAFLTRFSKIWFLKHSERKGRRRIK